ncbi:MAG: hypothetical protein J4F31_01800 [Flavobacteriales bacterium]|nr:hypothetical protein [Flavobacteriales bacterium]
MKRFPAVLLIGCLLIMFVYHLGIYGLRSHEPSALWFAMACLMAASRISAIGEYIVADIPGITCAWVSLLGTSNRSSRKKPTNGSFAYSLESPYNWD